MNKEWLAVMMAMLALPGQVAAQSLPSWSREDRALLIQHELIVGADLLPALNPNERDYSDDDNLEAYDNDLELIPDELLSAYFSSAPEDHLVNPQQLLSMQETMDCRGFLEYHANDSELDIVMYLFDASQQIPDPYSIEWLCREQYADEPLTAVVFCFLGNPIRNQIAFGGEGAAEVSPRAVRRMLDSARIKSMEKSEPATQLEAFVEQLSIRLYWLEKERKESRALALVNELDAAKGVSLYFDALSGDDTKGLQGGKPVDMIKGYATYAVAGLLGLLSLCGGLLLGWSLWSHSRSYRFPVFDPPERLGAKYAAGVGAVLAFHSELGSPSSQRSGVSNYLTRM